MLPICIKNKKIQYSTSIDHIYKGRITFETLYVVVAI